VTYSFEVMIRRKPGLSDPEGATTHKALKDLGFSTVEDISFGRVITISLEGSDEATAQQDVEAMCEKLLANPVIESYAIVATT